MPQTETWAVVDSSGRKICDYDTVDQLEDSNTASIPIEPQENGLLFAYDKVPTPIEVTVRLLFAGDYSRQNTALSKLEKCRQGTSTFMIVTPSRVFFNMTLVGFSTTRSATNGVNLLEVSCSFQEVKAVSLATQTVQWSPRNPTSADETNRGQVRAQNSVLYDIFN